MINPNLFSHSERSSSSYILRDYQDRAVQAGLWYFQHPTMNTGGLMVMPTGAGKSLVIASIANQLDGPTIIFQPSKEILEQNYGKLRAYGANAGVFSASVGRKDVGKLTFATIGSVIRRDTKVNSPDKPIIVRDLFKRFQYVIIDECHLVNAKIGLYRDFLEWLGPRKVMGLTATPYRLVTDGYGGSILKFLTRTRPRVFGAVIHYTQTGTLFANGYLSKLQYQQVEGFDSQQLKLNTTGADYTDKSVKAYYERIDFPNILAGAVRECIRHRRSVLVFTRFVEESLVLATKLNAQGYRCEIVTGETPKAERERVIEGFRDGTYPVVTNVGVLTTGFDFPELECVVIARPTMSLALYYQMIGRAVRPHPQKESAWVVDLCDNFPKFGRVEDLYLTAPKPGAWHIESRGRQLTNIYFGERHF